MKRLVKIPSGWLELEMSDDWIYATTYGEDGWEAKIEGGSWSPKAGPKVGEPSLAVFISRFAGVTQEEAEEIASTVLGEWKERRHGEYARMERGGVRWFVVAVSIAAGLAVFGLVSLIWLVTKAVR